MTGAEDFTPSATARAAGEIIQAAVSGDFDRAVRLVAGSQDEDAFSQVRSSLRAQVMQRWPQSGEDAADTWDSFADAGDTETALYNLAVSLWSVDELETALEAMNLALLRGDESIRAMLGEAQIYLGRSREGQENLCAALVGLGGSDPRTAGVLGRSYFRDNNDLTQQTLELLRVAADGNDEFSVDFAEFLIQTGDFYRAQTILEQQTEHGNPEAPIVLGNLLEDHFGDDLGAESAFLRGVELGDAHSAYNLASLLQGRGRLAESHNWLQYAAAHGDIKAVERLQNEL